MKAAVFYSAHDLRVEDTPVANLGEKDVLIRVRACGICGTDVHIFHGDEGAAKTPAGTALGHEFAGEIVQVGSAVKHLKPGDRVCVDPNQLCGGCEYCLGGIGHFCENMTGIGTTVHGGFAEYCVVAASQAYRFSDKISYDAAAMTEPVSCCLHGIDLCEIECGSTVAVIGCGMIGLIMLQLAKLRGAAHLIAVEPVAEKRQQALELGADLALDPLGDWETELKRAGITRIDTVIECAGRTDTMEMAIRMAGNKSLVMLFGLTAPNDMISVKPFEIFKKEITLKASFINPYTFSRALKLIESGKVDVTSMVYRTAPLCELPEILSDGEKRRGGKIIIHP